MLSTAKKIVLFLFGIALVVFGNRAAIKAMSGGEDESSSDKAQETNSDVENQQATIVEEIKDTISKEAVRPDLEEEVKKESKPVEASKGSSKKSAKEEVKTAIESDNAETATATE